MKKRKINVKKDCKFLKLWIKAKKEKLDNKKKSKIDIMKNFKLIFYNFLLNTFKNFN